MKWIPLQKLHSVNLMSFNNLSHHFHKFQVMFSFSTLDLLILADQYMHSHLKECCVNIIKRKITDQNAASLYHLAVLYKLEVGDPSSLITGPNIHQSIL